MNLPDFGDTFRKQKNKEFLISLSKLTGVSKEPKQTHVIGVIYGDAQESSYMISMLTNQSPDEILNIYRHSPVVFFKGKIDPRERYTDRQCLKVSPLRGQLIRI